MFDDYTDFSNQSWNGWVAKDLEMQIVDTRFGACLELPRQSLSGSQTSTLVSKLLTGLRPGVHYVVRMRVREAENPGTGAHRVGVCIDGGGPVWIALEQPGWSILSTSFTATRAEHEVQIKHQYMGGSGLGGGNLDVDEIGVTNESQAQPTDVTSFNPGIDPFNGWVKGANGLYLANLQDGSNYYCGFTRVSDSALMGGILYKQYLDWKPGDTCKVKMNVRRAGFPVATSPSVSIRAGNQDSPREPVMSRDWQALSFECVLGDDCRIQIEVRDALDLQAPGVWIDDLLISEAFEDVTDFSGADATEPFNGWYLDPATRHGVSVVAGSAGEGNVLRFSTPSPAQHAGLILSKHYPSLLSGVTFEFTMRVRATSPGNPARLSVTCGTQDVIWETLIDNSDWQDYRGRFTITNGIKLLMISNGNPERLGNDFEISKLSVRRVDLDDSLSIRQAADQCPCCGRAKERDAVAARSGGRKSRSGL